MSERKSVWALIREYSETQGGVFTQQEVISWMRRHAPDQANDRTIRTHVRGAAWNVGDRSQFTSREPFLTRVARGEFRRATEAEVAAWREASSTVTPSAPGRTQLIAEQGDASLEWHTEANTQRMLIEWLQSDGWTVTRAADTESGEHGIDVIAERGSEVLAVEVKGYPSRWRVRGPLRGERKAGHPNNQASKWFAHAVVPAMRVRGAEPSWRSAICFPDFPMYRRLYADTAVSLAACAIEMWLVTEDGQVERLVT